MLSRRFRKSSNVVVIQKSLIESKAFCELKTPASYLVFMVFLKKRVMEKQKLGKREEWVILNNGEIVFTYKEAEQKYGISGGRFKKSIEELINKGFIDITDYGGGVNKAATKYAMSDRWELYGTAEFKEVHRIKAPSYRGFQKGNQYGKNCREEKITTVVDQHSPTVVQ
jgi:hypothetical protein